LEGSRELSKDFFLVIRWNRPFNAGKILAKQVRLSFIDTASWRRLDTGELAVGHHEIRFRRELRRRFRPTGLQLH